jgi:hypothetical protein
MPFPIQDLVVTQTIPNATDAVNLIVLIAPFNCKLVAVRARHKTASTSGTMDVVKAASGTAVASGTTLLTATMSNAGTADTNVDGSVLATIGGSRILKGTAIGLKFAGTLTNLVNLDITIILRQQKLR